MLARLGIALLAAVLCAFALGACGEGTDPKTSVEASTAEDEQLAERVEGELGVYEEGFDLESVPEDQADQLAPVVDNLPQAAGGVEILRVDDGEVEAVTGFPDDEEGAITGRLICGAIERAEAGEGVVLGEGDSVLAECKPSDANFP